MQTITEAHSSFLAQLSTTKPDAVRGGRASIPDVEARKDHIRTVANVVAKYLHAAAVDLKDTCPEYKAPGAHGFFDCFMENVDEHLTDRMDLVVETIREEFEAQGEDPDIRSKMRREAA